MSSTDFNCPHCGNLVEDYPEELTQGFCPHCGGGLEDIPSLRTPQTPLETMATQPMTAESIPQPMTTEANSQSTEAEPVPQGATDAMASQMMTAETTPQAMAEATAPQMAMDEMVLQVTMTDAAALQPFVSSLTFAEAEEKAAKIKAKLEDSGCVCPKCNAPRLASDRYCRYCGMDVDQYTDDAQSRGSGCGAIAIGFVGFIVLIIIIILLVTIH